MARPTNAKPWGICDRTGFRYPLVDLVYEVNNGTRTGLRIGRDVVDPDHPQNFLRNVKTDDPKSLKDVRPDHYPDRGLFGWNPVGNPETVIVSKIGSVTVEIT